MTLSDLSIRRPVFAWMIMFGLIVFGGIGLSRLGVSMLPDVDFPVADIRVSWEGAAPEIIETELIDDIEQEVMVVDGVKEVRSTIHPGSANVVVEFALDTDIDAAVQEVQAAMSQVDLPLNVDPPVVRKRNPEEKPTMWIGVSSDKRSPKELAQFAERQIKDEIQIVPGVGEIFVGGNVEQNLRIWIDNRKLKKFQLTVLDVVSAIENEHVELAAGYIENSSREVNVRTMGEGLTVEEMRDLLITSRGGQPIYDTTIRLRDVARIEDGLADVRRITRLTGKAGIGMGVKKLRGSNEVQVAEAVRTKIDELNRTLPEDIEVSVHVDFSEATKAAVGQTTHELIFAAALTSLVCLLFLGSWRSAINVVLAIPTSVVGTFLVLYFLGFTLNLFTLLGLALAIGIVVDDAIMMLENIVRHFQMGKDKVRASLDGARQITFAAVAASTAVVAIFLPVLFLEGVIGKFFFQFGITMSVAVMLSLLEAVTLTPMRCSQFMPESGGQGRLAAASHLWFERLSVLYRASLQPILRNRWKVLFVSGLLFAVSLLLLTRLRKEFVPQADQNYTRITMRTPTGSSLAYTDRAARKVEAYLKKRPEVGRYYLGVGGRGGGGSGGVNDAFFSVNMIDRSKRDLSAREYWPLYRADLKKLLPDCHFSFADNSTRGLTSGGRDPLDFTIRGGDYAVLRGKSEEIMKKLEATGMVRDLDSDYRAGQPELHIVPDREAAALRGINMRNLSRTVNVAVGGLRTGKFTNNGRRYDVRIRLEEELRDKPEDIMNLQVRTMYGELVPLSEVVRLEEIETVQSISRINRQRAIGISAQLAPGVSQADVLETALRIARETLPEGYSAHLAGNSQTFQDSFKGLYLVLWLGVLIAYMVLAAQFNSFVHPFTVLLALPFSISGAFLALWMTGQSLNLYSFIGILLLMGIAKKNSILLVEFANQIRMRGSRNVHEALLLACPIRLRPILMTSAATIAAALPSAVGFGAGAENRMPMAITIIGGMIISTFFTLFVIPSAYSLLATLEKRRPGPLVLEEAGDSDTLSEVSDGDAVGDRRFVE